MNSYEKTVMDESNAIAVWREGREARCDVNVINAIAMRHAIAPAALRAFAYRVAGSRDSYDGVKITASQLVDAYFNA